MKPQFTCRVQGQDGKVYLVSTVRYRKSQWSEIWETAIFEGSGFLTLGRKQRFSDWAFDLEMAHTQYDETVAMVTTQPVRYWVMSSEEIKKTRRKAIELFMQPPSF